LRIFSKTTTAGIEIYDAWLRGLHNLINENFMLFRKVVDEENADSECLLNATSQMCESVIDRIIEATKDTPFEGIRPNLQEIKKSTDFKKNGHMMKAFLQPGIDASIFIMKAFKNSINGMSNGTLNMISKKKETT